MEEGGMMMTKLLEAAFTEARELPVWEQDALAAMILDEITENQQWKNIVFKPDKRPIQPANEIPVEYDKVI